MTAIFETSRFSWADLMPQRYYPAAVRIGGGDQGWDYHEGSLPALLPSFGFAVLWFALRHLSKRVLFPHFAKACGVRSRSKTPKFCYQLWLTVFYVSSCVAGYLTIRDEPFNAYPLNATTGSYIARQHPSSEPVPTKYNWYHSYQIGFYIAELMAIFIEPKRKDFLEYLLHHVITIGLLAGSYATYEFHGGQYINFIHDIPDVFLAIAKCLHYAPQKAWLQVLANTSFGAFVATFAFFRLYCLPVMIWVMYVVVPHVRPTSYTHTIMTYFLMVLQCLHLFWFYLIVKMIVRLATGVHGDVRSDESDTEHPSAGDEKKPKKKLSGKKVD